MRTPGWLRQWQALPRDKADTLLLLLACALVLAPHAAYQPWWVPLLCGTLLLWRGMITFRGNRMPERWLLAPLAVAVMVGVFASYRTLLGREAGVTMLVLLLSLKLLEMRARRDLFVVMFLSLFLMLASFFNSQSIANAAYTIVALIALLTTQLTFQYTGAVPPLARRLGTAARIVGLALPLMLVLFLLFPRIQGPLWGLPHDANSGRTGLSDSMSPGNISKLAQSEEIAFRVRFVDAVPPQEKLYWRGIVLGRYDGRTWTQLPAGVLRGGQIMVQRRGLPVRHQVTLEPTGRRWLFALELPQAAPQVDGAAGGFTPDLQLLAARPVNQRIRYDAASTVDFDLQPNESPAVLRHWLGLPSGYNPQALAYAFQLRKRHPDPAGAVSEVLQFFRNEPFRYTLEPPALGMHAVDEFLFSTRAGFCEHYSGAFVVLMRAAGIPARVVTGYQGGEMNPVDGFMSVRQSDAHAWAEVWLAGRGWVRVDPTAAVAPWRVERNLSSGLPRPIFGGLVPLNIGRGSWLTAWRMNWDAVSNRWNQFVLNYSTDRQKDLLRSLGFADPDWRLLIVLMFVLGSLVLAAIAIPLVRNRPRRDPLAACYQRLCNALARHGLPRAAHEGPRAYRLRVTAAASPLAVERKVAASRFLHLYETLRYGAADQTLPHATLAELKSLISKCR
jgi:protein-glutamine gamma-glutamyltransferase